MADQPFFLIDADFERGLAKLDRLRDDASDLRPFWREKFAPEFFSNFQENFNTEGRSVGGWPPLSATYAAWKVRKFPGRGILERSGRLRESLRWRGGDVGADGVFDAEADRLEVRVRVPYASVHQFGDGVPQRRFLADLFVDNVGGQLRAWLTSRIEGL